VVVDVFVVGGLVVLLDVPGVVVVSDVVVDGVVVALVELVVATVVVVVVDSVVVGGVETVGPLVDEVVVDKGVVVSVDAVVVDGLVAVLDVPEVRVTDVLDECRLVPEVCGGMQANTSRSYTPVGLLEKDRMIVVPGLDGPISIGVNSSV
jgi:hypothetical protein